MGLREANGGVVMVILLFMVFQSARGQLSVDFYKASCPSVYDVVAQVVNEVVAIEPRMGASLLRLHFHDCFVQGCDASLLLDDPNGEQLAPPNINSIRGLEVVDVVKTAVEATCPATVSCADILALVAEISVVALGGPSWPIFLGRRDSTTFAPSDVVVQFLIAPNETLPSIIQKFANVGLNIVDVVALSGAHTIGRARCVTFQDRLYDFNGTGSPDPTMDPSLLSTLQALCPEDASNPNGLTNLDQSTGDFFDNAYFRNVRRKYGVLQSDQELYSTLEAPTISLVGTYRDSKKKFFEAFKASMINMGNISPLIGSDGEIRLNCGQVNSQSSHIII